jgi:amylosucrase
MNLEVESKKCLTLVVSEVDQSTKETKEWDSFHNQLAGGFKDVFTLSFELYGHRYDFFYQIKQVVMSLYDSFKNRDIHLKKLDETRLSDSNWFRSQNMVGMACYVDLFADDLQGIRNKIGYFKDLGINYVHLMPLFKSPDEESDGGYAISSYREVDAKLGDMEELKQLADDFRQHGISLVLDFVFNHTADEHQWALKAKQGEAEFQDYYFVFDTKEEVEQYNLYLREIFPQIRRGSFTFDNQLKKWVWTTFNSFQWDLNYSNPSVFNAITEEMLFLANVGCDALRLDALAFIWKEMGTDCENQPKAHTLIQAFNRCLQIVSPAVVFKSEAIVHPDEVVKYIDKDECQLSYNPLLMALIWNSLATRKTFDDQVAADLGINGDDHRRFLNQFYTGRFPGSFANGVAFGENPSTGDCRVCGSLASLCGLERAQAENDRDAMALAVKRILLVHSIILSVGGVPLLYAGDELGLINDYSYQTDNSKAHDARWVQRINVPKEMLTTSPNPEITQALNQLIQVRQSNAVFGDASSTFLPAPNHHCFAYLRENTNERCLCIVNFSEHNLSIAPQALSPLQQSIALDLVSQRTIDCNQAIELGAYQFVWLRANK